LQGFKKGAILFNSCLATFWQHFIPDEQEKALLIEEKSVRSFLMFRFLLSEGVWDTDIVKLFGHMYY
jgi:hypothetical protein